MATEETTDRAQPRQWSEARRAAQDSRNGSEPNRLVVPLVLPGRGQVGRLEVPAELTTAEWDVLLGTMNAYRYAMSGPQQA